MRNKIKLAAVDIDGTFVHSDYTYDVPRFQRILSRMKAAGCHFVVASRLHCVFCTALPNPHGTPPWLPL